jgi:hypothetical protein
MKGQWHQAGSAQQKQAPRSQCKTAGKQKQKTEWYMHIMLKIKKEQSINPAQGPAICAAFGAAAAAWWVCWPSAIEAGNYHRVLFDECMHGGLKH